MKNKEYKLGDVFTHYIDGKNVELRVVSYRTCMYCIFFKKDCTDSPKCNGRNRSDKKGVMFTRNEK